MSNKKNGGSISGILVLLLLIFVGATEYGLNPGQRLLKFTGYLVGLAMGKVTAVAELPADRRILRVTRLSKQDFENTYGKFRLASSSGSSVQRLAVAPANRKMVAVGEAEIPLTASIPSVSNTKESGTPSASAAGSRSTAAPDVTPSTVRSEPTAVAKSEPPRAPAAPQPETPSTKPPPDAPAPSFSLQ